MSRTRLLFVAVLSVSLCSSLIFSVRADASMWTQTYGGANWDYGRCVVKTSDGGYAIAGQTSSYGAGFVDVWLVKTDEYGVVPESAWIVLPMLVIATLTIFISKKKLLRKLSKEN